MAKGLFREKSLDKINSPEQMDSYIKVAGPGMWLLLSSMILLLLGACVWGVFGRLETRIQTGAVCKNGVLTCYIPEDMTDGLTPEINLAIGSRQYAVESLSAQPQPLPADADAYALHLGGLATGDWVYTAYAQTDLPDGAYQAVIVTERISPLSFLANARRNFRKCPHSRGEG